MKQHKFFALALLFCFGLSPAADAQQRRNRPKTSQSSSTQAKQGINGTWALGGKAFKIAEHERGGLIISDLSPKEPLPEPMRVGGAPETRKGSITYTVIQHSDNSLNFEMVEQKKTSFGDTIDLKRTYSVLLSEKNRMEGEVSIPKILEEGLYRSRNITVTEKVEIFRFGTVPTDAKCKFCGFWVLGISKKDLLDIRTGPGQAGSEITIMRKGNPLDQVPKLLSAAMNTRDWSTDYVIYSDAHLNGKELRFVCRSQEPFGADKSRAVERYSLKFLTDYQLEGTAEGEYNCTRCTDISSSTLFVGMYRISQ